MNNLKNKILEYIFKTICKIIIYILSNILDKYNSKNADKLIKSHIITGIRIKSQYGWSPISYIHMTKPFYIYNITTKNGFTLSGADNHFIFNNDMKLIYLKDLKIGDKIQTKYGIDYVIKKTFINKKVSMCDISVLNNSESYFSNNILSHNTTTSAIFLLHYILFNFDKNTLVLGNKRKTAIEILDKIKKIFFEIPFYLKPGIYKWNEGEIVFDNGCRCMAEATTINSGISFTFHCVLADEFAHIPPNIKENFYSNLFPTIRAGNGRFIISSTQNGRELFYRLYQGAVSKNSEYVHFKVDWWQVPEWDDNKKIWTKRDTKWKNTQIANFGSYEAFNHQFGTDFEISETSLITKAKLIELNENSIEFIIKDLPGCSLFNKWYWHPDYNPVEQLKTDYIIFTIDISEGKRGDYTAININKLIKNNDEVMFETIGFFHSNETNLKTVVDSFVDILNKFCHRYLISLETNLYGELLIEYLNKLGDFQDYFVKFFNKNKTSYTIGTRLSYKNKQEMCLLFKSALERDIIKNCSTQFYNEIINFEDSTGNGTYKASFGHDDLVMSQIQLFSLNDSLTYKYFIEEFIYNNKAITNDEFNTYEIFDNNFYNMFDSNMLRIK